MKKISNKYVFDIIPFNENKYWIVSRGRVLLLNENHEIEYTSFYTHELFKIFADDSQDYFIYCNTSGKALFTKPYKQDVLLKIFTPPFSRYPIVSINDGYIYIDRSMRLKLININSKKTSSIDFLYKVYHIIKYFDKFILFIEKEDFDYYFQLCSFDGVKMSCEKEMHIVGDYVPEMYIHGKSYLVYRNNIEIDGRMEPTVNCINMEDWVCHKLFLRKNAYDNSKNYLMSGFSMSSDGRFLAMIDSYPLNNPAYFQGCKPRL